MIVADTSVLMAILKDEPLSAACMARLSTGERVLISAGTLTEALIVASGHDVEDGLRRLLDRFGFEVLDVSPMRATRAAGAYKRWGRGFHPAKLNFGDCFAYALAEEHACPLLYIGTDFAQTDVASAL